jgi:hypothetical protein
MAVPRLGELRLLPRVESPKKAQPSSNWTFRHALFTVGVLVALASLGLGIYFWAVTPDSADFDFTNQLASAKAKVDSMTPAETWIYWHGWTVPIGRAGLEATTTAQAVAFDREVEAGATYQVLAFSTAGFAVLFCLIVALFGSARGHGRT